MRSLVYAWIVFYYPWYMYAYVAIAYNETTNHVWQSRCSLIILQQQIHKQLVFIVRITHSEVTTSNK